MIPNPIPKNTTLEQWQAYEKAMIEHDAYYEAIRPNRDDYVRDSDYLSAHSEWSMRRSVFAPNKPGYTYSNNH